MTGRTSPLVSVVLPVRNAAATIDRALASLQGQTLSAFEVVVVDDGSSDDSARLVDGWTRRDARFRLIPCPGRGIVDALNTGLDAARGRYIARMDADDTCHPERLARQVAFLGAHPSLGVVSCRVRFGGDAQAQAGYARHVDWTNSLVTPGDLTLHRFVDCPFAHPSVLFRREVADRWGGYRGGDFPEDYECWLRWWEAGVGFGKVDAELLTWCDAPDRLSRTDARYAREAFAEIRNPYLARELTRRTRGRPVWLWGAGRVSRRRVDGLRRRMPPAGYVDIAPRRIGGTLDGLPVIAPEQLPPPGEAFVVPQVSSIGAAKQIADWLIGRGYQLGCDWLPIA